MSMSSSSFIVFLHVRLPGWADLQRKLSAYGISIKIDITLEYEAVASIFLVILKGLTLLTTKNDGGDFANISM